MLNKIECCAFSYNCGGDLSLKFGGTDWGDNMRPQKFDDFFLGSSNICRPLLDNDEVDDLVFLLPFSNSHPQTPQILGAETFFFKCWGI
jgi:hypothetical protein